MNSAQAHPSPIPKRPWEWIARIPLGTWMGNGRNMAGNMAKDAPKTSPRRPQMVKKHENSHVPGEWGALTPQEHTWESVRCHFKILLGLYSGVLWIIMCTMRPWGFPTMFLVMLMIQPSRNMATRDHLKILLRNVSERFIGLEGSSNAG